MTDVDELEKVIPARGLTTKQVDDRLGIPLRKTLKIWQKYWREGLNSNLIEGTFAMQMGQFILQRFVTSRNTMRGVE